MLTVELKQIKKGHFGFLNVLSITLVQLMFDAGGFQDCLLNFPVH